MAATDNVFRPPPWTAAAELATLPPLNPARRGLRKAPCHKGGMRTYIRASESVSEQAMAFLMWNGCTLVWGM